MPHRTKVSHELDQSNYPKLENQDLMKEGSSTPTDVLVGSTRASMFLVSGNVVATAIQAIGVLVVARILGPELYGVYNIALIVPNLAILFCDFGIDSSLIKFLAAPAEERKSSRAKILRTALLFRLSISAIMLLLSIILSGVSAVYLFGRPYVASYMQLASLTIIFQSLINFATLAFVGLEKTEYSAIVNNIQSIGKIVIAISLVTIGLGVIGALTGFIVGFLIGAVISLVLLFRIYRQISKNNDESVGEGARQIVRSILSYGLPIFVVSVLNGIGVRYQSIILATFASDEAVGNFNAAYNFIALMVAVANPLTLSVFQGFSRLSKNGEASRSFFITTTKYASIIMMPIGLLISVFSKELIFTIYGASFDPAALYLSLYSLMYLFCGLGMLTLGSLFNGLGETNLFLRMGLTNFITLLIFSPLLMNFLGVPGMIAAVLISFLTSTALGLHYASTRLDLNLPKRMVGKTYAATVLPAILLLAVLQAVTISGMLRVILGGVLYLFLYLTSLILLRVITRSDIEKIKNITSHMAALNYAAKPILKIMSFMESHATSAQ
jgi:O-antigen/teichoic acid export membrane protein